MTDKQMYKSQLDAIKARCEATTPGPWHITMYSVEDWNNNHICGVMEIRMLNIRASKAVYTTSLKNAATASRGTGMGT